MLKVGSMKARERIEFERTHMSIPWHDYVVSSDFTPAREAALTEKASVIGRIGIMMLSYGTTAWRVRNSMAHVGKVLGVTCTMDIGLVTINYTCIEGHESVTQSLSIGGVGTNTERLAVMERLIAEFEEKSGHMSAEGLHRLLDHIENGGKPHRLQITVLGAATACACFAFLLGGGLTEMICVFFGAGVGYLVRRLLDKNRFSMYIGVALSAAAACVVFELVTVLIRLIFSIEAQTGAGFICAVLFLVPGFPFITGILDLAKLDMRSGIERLVYSVFVMMVASFVAWLAGMVFGFEAENMAGLDMAFWPLLICRFFACFVAIFGFSMLFNSTYRMAFTAGLVGGVANLVRLELISLTNLPVPVAAFTGTFLAGLISAAVVKKLGFPRIAITIPAVVIVVPGSYIYQAIYSFGTGSSEDGLAALIKACSIFFALAMGILAARFCTDKRFRHRD